MKPGPTAIIACPECDRPVRLTTVLSGRGITTRHWTDGKLETPPLPQESRITRCAGCETFFWTSDADVLGYVTDGRRPPAAARRGTTSGGNGAEGETRAGWIDAEEARQLSSEEYLEALERGLADCHEEEVYLRVSAWWRANDSRRRGEADSSSFSPEERRNLRVLYERLAMNTPDTRLMKAEIARELGEFDRANRLLDHEFRDPELRPAARLIEDLIARGIRRVHEVR